MQPTDDAPDPYAHSMADLMAGVAAVFLLLAAVFILISSHRTEALQRSADERRREQQECQAAADLTERFRQETVARLAQLRIAVESDPVLLPLVHVDANAPRQADDLTLPLVFDRGAMAFPVSECALSESQRQQIRAVAVPLLRRICEIVAAPTSDTATVNRQVSMTLEGHTDRHPFFPTDARCGIEGTPRASSSCRPDDRRETCQALGFANNVRLSGARAQNVFFELRTAVEGDAALSNCLERNFVVSGRGPVDPVDGNDWRDARTAEVDALNRRVVLKIRMLPVMTGRVAP